MNGTTHQMEYSSTNASALLYACVGNMSDGDVLFFKEGNYEIPIRIDFTAKHNIVIKGSGWGTHLHLPDNPPLSGDEKYAGIFYFSGCENVTVRDMRFDGNMNATGRAMSTQPIGYTVKFFRCNNSYVENCWFEHCQNFALHFYAFNTVNHGWYVHNCHVNDVHEDGIDFANGATGNVTSMSITDCDVRNVRKVGIGLACSNPSGMKGVVISGNVISDWNKTAGWTDASTYGLGIQANGVNGEIIGNVVSGCKRGIEIQNANAKYNNVQGNQVIFKDEDSLLHYGLSQSFGSFNTWESNSVTASPTTGIGGYYCLVWVGSSNNTFKDNNLIIPSTNTETIYGFCEDSRLGNNYYIENTLKNFGNNAFKDISTNSIIQRNVFDGLPSENSGTATNSTATTFVFNHGLWSNATGVWASFNTTTISGCTWTSTTTQITVTVTGTGLPEIIACYWNAEYKP